MARKWSKLAHAAGIACEAELGAVLGHESGPLPPYEELFASGKGFTDVADARRSMVDPEAVARLIHGQPIPCSAPPETVEGYALQADGAVVAILTHSAADGQWWPRKVFAADGERQIANGE